MKSIPTVRAGLPGSSISWALGVSFSILLGACAAEEPVTDPQPIPQESPFRYPVELWDAGEAGETVVMVHVTEVGQVDSVYVLESSGRASFDSAAVAGARQLEFAPGRRGQEPVPTWARLPVRFSPPASGTGGSE